MTDAGTWRPPPEDPLVGMTDGVRVDEAIRERSQERWLRQQTVESATFAGIARDLAGRGAWVVVHSISGRSYQGVITELGPDHLAVRSTSRSAQTTYCTLAAVTLLRPDPGSAPPDAGGDRGAVTSRRLSEVLALQSAARPRILVVPWGAGEVLRGRLGDLGEDVVTVEVDDRDRTPLYVRLEAIAELAVVDG